jgi:CubicO group peptidase (beta-lactamase class C family)
VRKFLLIALTSLVPVAVWTGIIVAGSLEGWWRQPLARHGQTKAFLNAAVTAVDAHKKGNAAFVLLEGGRVVGDHFVSAGDPVDGDTRFQVASLSKWITAWGVMTLVEAGKLDLDKPVATYLRRWTLPKSEFDTRGVTVRRLLSHTAGLTDGLGYAGFAPGQPIQRLEDSLTKAADASPGASGAVHVGIEPGSTFTYSGGGYTLLQLLIEEVSGQSFNDYMKSRVLEPLGMTRSTFVHEDSDGVRLAQFFDVDGKQATHYRFTALAAASLYTTTGDLMRFLQAHVAGPVGERIGRGVLQPETLKLMRQPHATRFGAEIWGLGTILYAPNTTGGFVIGHDGTNAPAINTAARIDPDSGDGIVLLETGDPLLATSIAGEWVFWKTGNVDLLTLTRESQSILETLLAGWGVILLSALIIGWRLGKRRA